MRLVYDPASDALEVIFREAPVAESDESAPGVIIDYGADGKIVGIEVLDASQQLTLPIGVSFEVAAKAPSI